HDHDASRISKLRISSAGGRNHYTKLQTGGFGISRYTFDLELSKIAVASGAELMTGTRVNDIVFNDNRFKVTTSSGSYSSGIVIGCFGKRDQLDRKLNREFIRHHTGYMAVKYHIKSDFPADEIGL